MVAPTTTTPRPDWRSPAVPWIVLAAGLAMSILLSISVRTEVERQEAVQFERLTERLATTLDQKLRAIEQALHAGRALVESTDVPSRLEWARFVDAVLPFCDRGLVGIGYVQRVPRAEIDRIEAAVRAEGLPDFAVQRLGDNPLLYVVTHLEPLSRNRLALGKDVGSGTVRRTAADDAMRTGGAVITRKIGLIEGAGRAPGCLLFLPVYRREAPLADAAAREAALRGWVYASLRVDLLWHEVARALDGHASFEVFEDSDASAGNLLYDTDDRLRLARPDWENAARREGAAFAALVPLRVYGRAWHVRVHTSPAFEDQQNRSIAWFVLFGGAALSFFGTGFTWALVNKRRQALRLAEQLTASTRRAEAEVRKLALVASRTASSVMVMDRDWRVEWVNDSFTRLFGYRLEEVRGRRPSEFLHGPESEEAIAHIDERCGRGQPFQGEVVHYTKQGKPRWVELDIQPLTEDGVLTGFTALQLDITERKHAEKELARKEAEFRFIFESAPLGLSWLWVGPDGSRRRLTNDAHLAILGLTREQMRDPDIFRRITHPDDWAAQQELYSKLERGEIDRFAIKKRYRRLDGREIRVELTFHRFRDAAGGYQEVSTLVDLTPLQRAQDEVVRKEAQFRFIFEAAPIGILWRRVSPDGHVVRHVNDAHLRMTGLRREEIFQPGAFAAVSFHEEYEQQQKLYAQLAAGEIDHFSFEKRYRHRDGQIVWVLLTQQRRDYPDGAFEELSTLVDITARKQAEQKLERERSRFKVMFEFAPVGLSWFVVGRQRETHVVNSAHARLTGVPIERSHEPEQYRLTTHPEDNVKQQELTAQLERGEIDHFSLEKRYVHPDGAVVWAVLTVRRVWDPATGETQQIASVVDITSLKRQTGEASPVPRRRLLLADDNPVNQKVAAFLLSKLGYEADIVGDGNAVLAALEQQSYEIVILDVNMPGMDGLTAARVINERWPDRGKRPWLIALTANAMDGDREACLAAGVDDYLCKPIRSDVLREVLERATAELAKQPRRRNAGR